MNFKLSLISTALFNQFSVSAFAETEQPIKQTLKRLNKLMFQDTGY